MRFAYQTRIKNFANIDIETGFAALDDYAALYCRIERKLFADIMAGKNAKSLRKQYSDEFNIPQRMFSTIRTRLEGKIESIKALQKINVDGLNTRIKKTEKIVNALIDKGKGPEAEKKIIKLNNLQNRLFKLESDIEDDIVRLTFGSNKLWRKQYHLEANGYSSHEEWLTDWREARSNSFNSFGDKGAASGNVMCTATLLEDGNLTIRLRMPYCLEEQYGKYVNISNINFNYGHDYILRALDNCFEFNQYKRKYGDIVARRTGLGQSMNYTFKRDEKGWRIFAVTDIRDVPVVTDKSLGSVGVDINADHLAVCEVDSEGNYINAFNIPLVTYGKSVNQADAIIGNAVAELVAYAVNVGKPLVMEKLNFTKKKDNLEGESKKYKRMLSSFPYAKVKTFITSRAYRNGVEVKFVNPAYSSIAGRVKFQERYGLSSHQSAAMVLARRLFGFSERVPHQPRVLFDNGDRIGFGVPVRSHQRHVWSSWAMILKRLKPELAAQHRPGKRKLKRKPDPLKADSSSSMGLSADQFDAPKCDSWAESICIVGSAVS